MFGRKKKVIVETYSHIDINKVNKQAEKNIEKRINDGYLVHTMVYSTSDFLGVTSEHHCTVTYMLGGRRD